MNQIVLHLGSNVGDRKAMLQQAISLIQDRIGKVTLLSSIYETEAWGKKDQADFLNQAVLAETALNPSQAMDSCKAIENQLGSIKLEKWGPRTIDVDILFYNQSVISDENLKIPHPMIEKRNFVLIPLMEILGDFIHPVSGKTIEELYEESDDNCEVFLFEESN